MIDCVALLAQPKQTACFILYRNGKCLMESRPDLHRIGLDPYWVYPGGKIEPDELASDAAIRECTEELGVYPTGKYNLEPVTGPNGWAIVPYVFVYWHGNLPERTLDHHHSPLSWRAPHTEMGQSDGSTCVREIANQIARRLDEIHTLYCEWRTIMSSL